LEGGGGGDDEEASCMKKRADGIGPEMYPTGAAENDAGVRR